jgi:hypothetical protein
LAFGCCHKFALKVEKPIQRPIFQQISGSALFFVESIVVKSSQNISLFLSHLIMFVSHQSAITLSAFEYLMRLENILKAVSKINEVVG